LRSPPGSRPASGDDLARSPTAFASLKVAVLEVDAVWSMPVSRLNNH
jgi:hypothetical protein